MNVKELLLDVDHDQVHKMAAGIKKLQEYIDGNGTFEDQAVVTLDNAFMAGYQVINYRLATTNGGLDEKNMPKIAFARSDAATLGISKTSQGLFSFQAYTETVGHIWTDMGTAPEGMGEIQSDRSTGLFCMVPIVPTSVRAKLKDPLSTHITVFETEGWHETARRLPIDPILVEPLLGTRGIGRVIDAWEMTEAERKVMEAVCI